MPLIEPIIVRTRAIALANVGGVLFFMAFATMLLGGDPVPDLGLARVGAPGRIPDRSGTGDGGDVRVPGGILGQRFGQRYVGAAGALLFALGGLWFRSHMAVHPHYASALLPSQLLGGAGVGLVLPTLSAAATSPLPASRFATGAAVLGMARQLGSALGVAIFVAIIGHPTAATAIHAFRGAWVFLIASAFAAGVVLLSVGPVRIASAGSTAEAAAAEVGEPAVQAIAA